MEEEEPLAEVCLLRLPSSIHAGRSSRGLQTALSCSPLNSIDGDGETSDVSYDATTDVFHDSSHDFDCDVDCRHDDVKCVLNRETSPCRENLTFENPLYLDFAVSSSGL